MIGKNAENTRVKKQNSSTHTPERDGDGGGEA